MPDAPIARLARRVRDRVLLAWEESRVSGTPVPADPLAADIGETRFVPIRLAEAGSRFPPTDALPAVADVERRLGAHAEVIRLIAGAWVPRRNDAVAGFVDHLSGWGRILAPGERLYWVQPLSNNFVLSADEAEQMLGLVGRVDFVESTYEAVEGRSPCLIAGGVVRRRSCAIGLSWGAHLVSDPHRLGAALVRLRSMPDAVRGGVHIIEAPTPATSDWSAGGAVLLRALAAVGEAIFGVRVANTGSDIGPVRTVIAQSQAASRLAVQWIDDWDASDVPAAPPALEDDILCDCSLSVDAPGPARAYVQHGAYVPVPFDARVPRSEPEPGGIVEMPRTDGRAVPPLDLRGWTRATVSPERDALRALRGIVDAPIDALHDRLLHALDTARRHEYLVALASDPAAVGRWHEFHVYNWPPPPPSVLRFVVYDAAELLRGNSSLRALEHLSADPIVVSGRAFIGEVRRARESAPSAAVLREKQIAAHEYLATGGRQELTADSERLIDELPATLGATLEIGFGYGLTARRVARRATTYVGIDLRPEQARALAAHGGRGLVADIHSLPLAGASFDTVLADNVLEHAASPLRVLEEIRRVLRPGGRAYVLIPPDAATSEFQIRTHLWKADERSIARAAALAGLAIVTLQVLSYAELAVYGCFPASAGKTCLVVLERPAASVERRAS